MTVSNFSFLELHDVRLSQLGLLAERYFREDPSTSIVKPAGVILKRIKAGRRRISELKRGGKAATGTMAAP